jgi:protoporphyrinogen/coproporphyrinogen III oxidase
LAYDRAMPLEQREVVVVGAGIAGLTAAHELRDRDVVVLESSDRVGGRIRSEPRGDNWLNFGAHVFGGATSATGRLLSELGVRAEPVPGRLAAVSLNGKLVSRGPVESFPFRLPLSVGSRAALVRTGLKLRLAVRRYAEIAAPREGEDPAERQRRMLAFMDDRSFAQFAGPLPDDVDLLFRSTLTRSSGEPEELAAGYGVGYFHLVWDRKGGLSRNILGGSSVVTETLAAGLGERVRCGVRVAQVEPTQGGVRVDVDGGDPIEARAAVVATPAYATREMVAGLPEDTSAALAAVPYGPYVVGAFLTSETGPVPWDDLYAVATPKRSFSMLFNTANVRRVGERMRAPGGSLMVYAAAGFARRLWGLDDAGIRDAFLADLYDVLPGTRGLVEEVVIRGWERGLPYPRVGRSTLQPALTRSLEPIFLAGDYLGTWYTETAVQTGLAAAGGARAALA